MSLRFLNFAGAFGLAALSVYILVIGKDFLVPLVSAVVVWYLIINLAAAFGSASLGGFRLPRPVAMALAIAACVTVLWAFFGLVNSSVTDVVAAAPGYQARFEELLSRATTVFNLDLSDPFEKIVNRVDLGLLVSGIVRALTGLAGDLGLIVIYVLFLLLEQRTFDAKLTALAGNPDRLTAMREVLDRIGRDVNSYARIKTSMAAITAALSYVVMLVAGVDFAPFWAVLIFLLNYIPAIGAILGVFFPMMLVVVQFASPLPVVVIGALLIAIPVIMNNLIEPKLMGRSLNLSALVILLSLALWGSIWGIIGMFLCVPLMVILNIVLAKFPQTRAIAILLSADGKVS